MNLYIVFSLVLAGCTAICQLKHRRHFPDDFIFGASTSSYQIEGGWRADDKGESIWDHLVHNYPEAIVDSSNGDIAADTYHNYRRDVQMMIELGIDVYRFSVSWPRILPDGTPNRISEAGITFYNNYINEMLKYNITPMATIYHWDLPQKLQQLGGLMNPMFGDWFEDYARVVFANFGDRVKFWITFNEPFQICHLGYGADKMAPRANATGVGDYICAKNLVMAHARVYRAYYYDFKPTQGGICGITSSIDWYGPLTDSEEDEMAAELMRQASWALYTDPIFTNQGGFPRELSERVAEKSKQQGYPRSRLPEFTEEERNYAMGTYDFLGINHYSGELVSANEYRTTHVVPSLLDDIDVGTYVPNDWPKNSAGWLPLAPNSLLNVLNHVRERYNNPIIFITENGWATPPDTGRYDDDRITYYRAALENVLDALDAGVNVRGYMAWSLMDNFEWMLGYSIRFGLYQVDYKDPARTRSPKKSAYVYKQIIRDHVIDYRYNPDVSVPIADECW